MSAGVRFMVHGVSFCTMRPDSPRGNRNGLTSHTVRHFLRADEHWERLKTPGAVEPAWYRSRLEAEGADLRVEALEKVKKPGGEYWWDAPFATIVQDAHAHGYGPRYKDLIGSAGRIGERGSKWIRQTHRERKERRGPGEKQYYASIRGFRVGVVVHGDTQATVLTAHASLVVGRDEVRKTTFNLGSSMSEKVRADLAALVARTTPAEVQS